MSGVLQIPGLTHFKQYVISLQLVLRPNTSSVCFKGTSMALLAQIYPEAIVPQYGSATP